MEGEGDDCGGWEERKGKMRIECEESEVGKWNEGGK